MLARLRALRVRQELEEVLPVDRQEVPEAVLQAVLVLQSFNGSHFHSQRSSFLTA